MSRSQNTENGLVDTCYESTIEIAIVDSDSSDTSSVNKQTVSLTLMS